MNGSIASRLALMFAACAAAVFLVAGAWLHDSLRVTLEQQTLEDLALRGALMEGSIGKALTAEQWTMWIVPKLEAVQTTQPGTHVQVVSADARFSFGEVPLPGSAPASLAHERRVAAQGDRPALTLRLARERETVTQTLNSFRTALLVTALVGVALVALLGYWIAGLGLRPLARLSRQAQTLRASEPAERLGFVPMPRELAHLTDSFNGALERLQHARTQLEAFNANVAHELRTPLGNLIGQTQVAMLRQRTAAELAEVLCSNLEELERMRGIVNDMLFLARADQGAQAGRPAAVRLADQVSQVIEFLEPLAADRKLRVDLEGDAPACVEPALIRRAVSNLLRNAIEHCAPGGQLAVCIDSENGLLRISVSNPGPAIETRHLGRLFDRFYRADASRRNSNGNHGLGLSIVQAVATMHGGQVFARSERGWNTFGFTVTRATATAETEGDRRAASPPSSLISGAAAA
jgi:two-component system heavy metal sensor histidine kinase CusS